MANTIDHLVKNLQELNTFVLDMNNERLALNNERLALKQQVCVLQTRVEELTMLVAERRDTSERRYLESSDVSAVSDDLSGTLG